jgi:hypothetical protein
MPLDSVKSGQVRIIAGSRYENFYRGTGSDLILWGALTFRPPMFSPSDNLTHTVSPSDNWTAVCLVLVTVGPSPNPKVDELFVQPKNEHLYTKI